MRRWKKSTSISNLELLLQVECFPIHAYRAQHKILINQAAYTEASAPDDTGDPTTQSTAGSQIISTPVKSARARILASLLRRVRSWEPCFISFVVGFLTVVFVICVVIVIGVLGKYIVRFLTPYVERLGEFADKLFGMEGSVRPFRIEVLLFDASDFGCTYALPAFRFAI